MLGALPLLGCRRAAAGADNLFVHRVNEQVAQPFRRRRAEQAKQWKRSKHGGQGSGTVLAVSEKLP